MPTVSGRHEWFYIIDLDTDTFNMESYDFPCRRFRFDNILVLIFTSVSHLSQLMIAPVPQSAIATSSDFDPEFLSLYGRTKLQLSSINSTVDHSQVTPEVLHDQVDVTPRVRLHHMLIYQFCRHCWKMFEHATAESGTNIYIFRQLVYGLLNIDKSHLQTGSGNRIV